MKDDKWQVLIVAGLLIGLYLVMKNSPRTTPAISQASGWSEQSNGINISPISIRPSRSYDNEEIREIEYNADGLPSRIVIHRHAIAA